MNRLFHTAFAACAVSLFVAGCTATPNEPEQAVDTLHPFHDRELLVLDPPADYLRHLPDLGLEIIDVTDLASIGEKLYHLRITDGAHPFDGRDKHRDRFPNVVIDAHHHYEHHVAQVDRSYTARKAANWPTAMGACAKGIRIGVIDGVVDVKHAAFKGTKITYKSFHLSRQKVANTGHGTAVASVLTGRGAWAGLLPGAEIVAANVFHKSHSGKAVGSAKSIVRAVDWMISKKVPIINMSLGGGRNAVIEKAIQHARDKGVIVIASAGNNGPFSKKINYPSAYPSVIAITAVDRFDRNARFSSKGDYIDFATPGVDIWTAVPGGGKAMSGTSFAAPMFTGYAAAAMKHRGIKTTEELRRFFQKHAKDTANPGRDRFTGWGVVKIAPPCAS